MIADPISLLDSSPHRRRRGGGGARAHRAGARRTGSTGRAHRRARPSPPTRWPCTTARDPLCLEAASSRRRRAYAQAGRERPTDIDFFELHDAFTIMAALSLEAVRLRRAGPGRAPGQGGRDHACRGASPSAPWAGSRRAGIRSAPRASTRWSRRCSSCAAQAGANQVPGCAVCGLTQNIGGSGATVVTHILERTD